MQNADMSSVSPGGRGAGEPESTAKVGEHSGSFKIGRAFGADVRIHWTFLLVLSFFTGYAYVPGGSLAETLLLPGLVLALFASALLHECGHAFAVRRLGVEIADVTLRPLGTLHRAESISERPADEARVAVAGPLANAVLALALGAVAYLAFGSGPWPLSQMNSPEATADGIFAYLATLNAVLTAFYLMPVFPMDGGRLLRGVLATRQEASRATAAASATGQVFLLMLVFYALLSGGIALALMAVIVSLAASREAQSARRRETLRGLTVADVMGTSRRTETITPYHTFGQVFDVVIHGYQQDFPVVDEGGRPVGMLTRGEILAAAHSPQRFATVRDLMRTEFPTVSPEDDLLDVGCEALGRSGMRAIPVASGGELVGVLTVEDIGQANLARLAGGGRYG